MKSLAEFYKDKAFECKEAGDGFGCQYWLHRAYEAECLENY